MPPAAMPTSTIAPAGGNPACKAICTNKNETAKSAATTSAISNAGTAVISFRGGARRTAVVSRGVSDDLEERAKRLVGRAAIDNYVRPDTLHRTRDRFDRVLRDRARRRTRRKRRGAASRPRRRSKPNALCHEFGVRLVRFGAEPIDVAVDGADEVAPDWSLIKGGGGGALFREKAVALAAKSFVVVVTGAQARRASRCVSLTG